MRTRLRFTLITACLLSAAPVAAQQRTDGAVITGRVVQVETGAPVIGAAVSIEGAAATVSTDSAGVYRLTGAPSGPQVIEVRHIGFATRRVPVNVPATGTLTRDIEVSVSSLRLEGITVTADAQSRARGELGTASVVGREAIVAQSAASLAGILELVPGTVLAPPGLDGVQQASLRSAPTSTGTSSVAGPGVSASALTAFGTLIVLDGIPLSNNSNMQAGGLAFPTSAGGGIDLRRIPASTIERVEVLRGIPSARYGDLTQGAILVETRAGVVPTNFAGRLDQRTGSTSVTGGYAVAGAHALSVSGDVARTRISPGVSPDHSYRYTFQLAHRGAWGESVDGVERLVADTRIDAYRLTEDRPEDPALFPGRASSSRETGVRLSHRLRLARPNGGWTLQAAADLSDQSSYAQRNLTRSAMPFTDRVEEGRSIGGYVEGEYVAATSVDGEPRFLYARAERELHGDWLASGHELRAGAELRREWNAGDGLQYDIRYPPQITFTGIRGHARPRAFNSVPPLAVSALYLDDRIRADLGAVGHLNLQLGVRADVLHEGGSFTEARDVALQPRLNAELVPIDWLRLRAGWGRTAKTPAMLQLYPAPEYYDLVNVNWFTNEPAERLAVMTTFIRDPTNPELGFALADKLEAGVELALGTDAAITFVGFRERMDNGIGMRALPEWLPRERFQLSDSTFGTGRPPAIIEPAYRTDTIPVLIRQPANHVRMWTDGLELIGSLPEIRPLRTRVQLQAAWTWTEFQSGDRDYGTSSNFEDMQLRDVSNRVPFWEPAVQRGERRLLTYRIVHHQPALGLVVTATMQHMLHDGVETIAEADSLSFTGYLTRGGETVEVAPAERSLPEYADLRRLRRGLFPNRRSAPADYIMALQATKTLPANGRVSFWAYNLFDHIGYFGDAEVRSRAYQGMRFGLEMMLPLEALRW